MLITALTPDNRIYADDSRIRNSVWHRQNSCGCRRSEARVRCRAVLHVFLQIRRSLELFCLYKCAEHMKCEHSFAIFNLRKSNFSVVHQSECMLSWCTRDDDIDLFQRNRRRQCATLLDHDISYTRCKWREQMRQRWRSCLSCTWSIITKFVGVDEHHETEDGKTRLPAEQEKSRLHARISFLLVSWDIDMCQRLYRWNYNIHVCC